MKYNIGFLGIRMNALVAIVLLAGLQGCGGTQQVSLGEMDMASGGAPGEPSAQGGSGASTVGGFAPSAGTPGSGGASGAPALDCPTLATELTRAENDIQACTDDDECGASLSKGTCGCTRALPVRIDADVTEYSALSDRYARCRTVGGGVCDCPTADGFRCVENRCAWNYVR